MKTNISKEQVISLTRSSQSSFNASISLYQLDSNNNTYSNYNVYTMNKELVDTRYVDNVLVFQISFSNPINYLINHIYLDFEVSSETGHALYSLHTFNSSNRTYQNISSERLGYLESIVIDNIQYARIDLYGIGTVVKIGVCKLEHKFLKKLANIKTNNYVNRLLKKMKCKVNIGMKDSSKFVKGLMNCKYNHCADLFEIFSSNLPSFLDQVVSYYE